MSDGTVPPLAPTTSGGLTPTFSKYDAQGVAKGYLSSEEFLREMLSEADGVDVDAAMGQIVAGGTGPAALTPTPKSDEPSDVLWYGPSSPAPSPETATLRALL
jgi:hypothetical protein